METQGGKSVRDWDKNAGRIFEATVDTVHVIVYCFGRALTVARRMEQWV